MARLSCLVGRGRALEILLVADDLDGPRAEQYGYVNRLIADDQLFRHLPTLAQAARLRISGSTPTASSNDLLGGA
jgi:enoyl-CoA hydratase/carnithine racemase